MTRWLIVIFSVVLLTLTGFTLWLTRGAEPVTVAEALGRLEPAAGTPAPANIGGAFSLTDQNGRPVTDANLRGHLVLVFFGYTQCPDVCPVTLATISSVINHLGPKAAQVVPVFISVDPAHDTPAVLKDYLKAFSPSIVGLTGSRQQVAEAAKAYKVYFAPSGDGKEERIDHSSVIYLMGKDGKYLSHFSAEDTEQAMLQAVNAQLN